MELAVNTYSREFRQRFDICVEPRKHKKPIQTRLFRMKIRGSDNLLVKARLQVRTLYHITACSETSYPPLDGIFSSIWLLPPRNVCSGGSLGVGGVHTRCLKDWVRNLSNIIFTRHSPACKIWICWQKNGALEEKRIVYIWTPGECFWGRGNHFSRSF